MLRQTCCRRKHTLIRIPEPLYKVRRSADQNAGHVPEGFDALNRTGPLGQEDDDEAART